MANILTPTFRMNFPRLFKAEKNQLSGKEEFSVVALFPKGTDLTALNKAVEDAINDKWPDKKKRPANLRSPIRKQDEKEQTAETGEKFMPAGYKKGAFFLNLKSQQRPGVVDQNVQPIIEESEIYSGAYARASIRAYAYDQAGNRGVAFGLVHLQKVKDGDPLTGRSKPEADFAPIAGSGGASPSDAAALFS